jgi:hypothetical protein
MRMKREIKRIPYIRILNYKVKTGCNKFEWRESVGYFLHYFQRKFGCGFRNFYSALTGIDL